MSQRHEHAAGIIAGWRDDTLQAEQEGRDRYLDLTPEQRAAALAEVARQSTSGPTEQERRFARGWLDEYRRQQRDKAGTPGERP
jgi:hypothetical protein